MEGPGHSSWSGTEDTGLTLSHRRTRPDTFGDSSGSLCSCGVDSTRREKNDLKEGTVFFC